MNRYSVGGAKIKNNNNYNNTILLVLMQNCIRKVVEQMSAQGMLKKSRGNVRRGNVRSGKSGRSGKCP